MQGCVPLQKTSRSCFEINIASATDVAFKSILIPYLCLSSKAKKISHFSLSFSHFTIGSNSSSQNAFPLRNQYSSLHPRPEQCLCYPLQGFRLCGREVGLPCSQPSSLNCLGPSQDIISSFYPRDTFFDTSTDIQNDTSLIRYSYRKFPHAQLLEARLIEDMAALPFHIQRVSDISKNAAARISGTEGVPMSDDETTFEQLQARIQKTIDYLNTVSEDSINGKEDQEILLKTGVGEYRFTALSYLLAFSLPNFYFHVTTAYDLLRHKGVPIGKWDYLGAELKKEVQR